MRNFLTGLIAALIAIALSLGLAPASNASTGDSVTVESISYAETSAKATVKSETQALIGGATQLTWEEPNHSVVVTAKQLKKAVSIKVNATGANSSKVIYKTAKAKAFKQFKKTMPKAKAKKAAVKASRIVILKAGSCVRNRGRLNNKPLGFVWCPGSPVVLTYDAKSDQYRHSHTLLTASGLEALKQELASQGRLDELEVVGTVVRGGVTYFIVKWCLNYIGGDVVMIIKVVQVRFPQNLLMEVELESIVDVSATAKASLVCPTGTLYGEATASASGSASASIRVMIKNKAAAVDSESARILAEARIKAKTAASALAQAKIKLECGVTPPPPVVYQAPTASGAAKACVNPGQQNGVITASGTNPNAVAAPGTLVVGGKTKDFSSVGAGQSVTFDFSGFAPGKYDGSFTLGAPVNKSVPFTVTVDQCPAQPKAIISLDELNDVDETDPNCEGTRDECESFLISTARATIPNGVAGTLRINSNIGTVGFSMGTDREWRDDVPSIPLTAGQHNVEYRFNAPTEGSSATVTLTFTPDGGGDIVTATANVVINDTLPIPQ